MQVHSTNFMIDYKTELNDETSFQKFMKNEPNYDLSFCQAWSIAASGGKIKSSHDLLSLLDKIQQAALSHFTTDASCLGRALNWNGFGFRQGLNSDALGVRELIQKIWLEKSACHFEIKAKECIYILTNEKFFTLSFDKKIEKVLLVNQEKSPQIDIDKIFNEIIPNFDQPTEEIYPRFSIIQITGPAEREKEALKIMDVYLRSILLKRTDSEKIQTIAITLRDLEQLHLYNDGNGRSLYILANILLAQNGVSAFYPKNMCLFDANSIQRIVEEIKEGQKRFSTMFENLDVLTQNLITYYNTVIQLEVDFKLDFSKFPLLRKAFTERNLDLLFRLCAVNPETLGLLKFLISNRTELNINIFSQGQKSGTALDVANQNKNVEAIKILNVVSKS